MTEKEYKEALVFLKRFLKENDCYPLAMKYLLPINRDKNDLLKAINGTKPFPSVDGNETESYYPPVPFSGIFSHLSTIGTSYDELGHGYWEKYIKPISDKFYNYCKFKERKYINNF